MKKILLLLVTVSTAASAQVSTCSLDPTFVASNKKGIWPDSALNFVSGTVGVPYYQNLTIKVPKDTVVNPLTMCFNRVEVSTPNGYSNFNLPPGLNMLAGNNVTVATGTYKFPGNANTCAEISGTPTVAGTYTCQFRVQAYLTPSGGSCPGSPNVAGGSSSYSPPSTLTYYKIVISPPAGINEKVSKNSFALRCFPNPATSKVTLKFVVEDEAEVKISLYHLLGGKVYENRMQSNFGENAFTLNLDKYSDGVYFYKVQYKQHSETGRLVVNHRD